MIEIKDYTDRDFTQLESLLKQCDLFDETYDNRVMIKKKIEHDPESIIVAKDSGNIVGSVFIIYDPWSSFIYRLGVHPDYRNQGLGKRLMETAEERLYTKGTNPITIFVLPDNKRVLEFYKRIGYGNEEDVLMLEELKSKHKA